jgi:nucleoid-associated protein YgaU
MTADNPKADFSDVKGGSSSQNVSQSPSPSQQQAQTYTVVSGDSLSRISKRIYGDASKWKKIYEANTDQIENPDLIYPGQVLKIPSA